MSNHSIKVLDCTFRDGGYYNNWYYEPKTVKRYLSSMAASGVDIVEIGFRFPAQKEFCGPFAYCTDDFLKTLDIPQSFKLAVMINAKDYLSQSGSTTSSALIKQSFAPKSESPVSIVRIAAHFKELSSCSEMVKQLVDLGYKVGFNLMQATGKSPEELASAAKLIASWGNVDVLYFADSFGNMRPLQIKEMASALRAGWHGELGVHTHDNMGLGLSNSLEALANNVTWIDSTVLGMGRGAGNTQTEHLLVELVAKGFDQYHPQALFALVLEDFAALKAKYSWGSNLLYYLSAAYSIHPTYVQELLNDGNRNSQNILDSLEYLRTSDVATSYDAKRFARSLYGTAEGKRGSWTAKKLLGQSREILILGPGPSARDHREGLNALARKRRMPVLATNTVDVIDKSLVTAHVACHHTKLMLDYDRYKSLGKPIILPLSLIPKHAARALQDVDVWDYGLVIKEDSKHVTVEESLVEMSSNLVAGYALAVAVASGSETIMMAGFDGFSPGNPEHTEMQLILDRFKQAFPKVRFIAVTPTTYMMESGSVYAPGIAPGVSVVATNSVK